jgi:antitoxin (DNA-binding transcriptional repressor) of toxin-antitoxin stability system
MKRYTVSEARERFAEVIALVEQGEEVSLTRHGAPIATISRSRKRSSKIPPPGFLRKEGWTVEMVDDFNTSIPEGFEECV